MMNKRPNKTGEDRPAGTGTVLGGHKSSGENMSLDSMTTVAAVDNLARATEHEQTDDGLVRHRILTVVGQHQPANPDDLCLCGRPAEMLIGVDLVPYCAIFDAAPEIHSADKPLQAALNESKSAAISTFLAQVPAATLATAVRAMAHNHPEDAARYEQWATQLDREADTEALAHSVGFLGDEQAVSR